MIYVIRPDGMQILHPSFPKPSRDDIGSLLADERDVDGRWSLVTLHVLLIAGQTMQLLHDTQAGGELNSIVTHVLRNLGEPASFKVTGAAVVLTGQHMLSESEVAGFNEQGMGHA